MRQNDLDDSIIEARWEFWRFQIDPILSKLPSSAVMQRANQAEALERLHARIDHMRDNN